MTMYDILKMELGYNVDVSQANPILLDGEVKSHYEEYDIYEDEERDFCKIYVTYADDAVKEYPFLLGGQFIWLFYKWRNNKIEQWFLDVIE